MSDDRTAVRDALQRGYGDATQTVLDDQVAGQVIGALREQGWFTAQEVAAIVLAAGGSVTVPEDLLQQVGDLELMGVDDVGSGGRKLIARRRP